MTEPTPGPDYTREAALLAAGHGRIAGIDEAGRGPLAGPVVAAAVVLDPARLPAGLADSKALSAAARQRAFEAVIATADVGIGIASAARIDSMNIRGATLWAMAEALAALPRPVDHAVIDGRDLPTLPVSGEAIIKGDAKVLSIAAASIVAKVWRDGIMAEIHESHPEYGFASNQGYPTAAHRQALTVHGACRHHRRSFAPVRAALMGSGA